MLKVTKVPGVVRTQAAAAGNRQSVTGVNLARGRTGMAVDHSRIGCVRISATDDSFAGQELVSLLYETGGAEYGLSEADPD